jgi:hypothetical protein
MGGAKVHASLLPRLGRHKIGGGCLYLPDLDAVDHDVLLELIRASYTMNATTRPKAAAAKSPTVGRRQSR